MSRSWLSALAFVGVLTILAACAEPGRLHELVITTDSGSASLEVGESVQLSAELVLRPDFPVRIAWTSSDEDVLTVSEDGLATAVGAGSATVTGRTTHTSNAVGEIEFTVSGGVTPAVTSVSVSLASSALLIGETTQATPTVVAVDGADESVQWSSSNESVLTVSDSGLVTAVAVGVADVVATSVFDPSMSGSASLTVAVQPEVLSVTVALEDETLAVGETTLASVQVVAVGGADEGVVWSSGDETVLTVTQDGLVTAVGAGSAMVRATSVADPAVSDDRTLAVHAAMSVLYIGDAGDAPAYPNAVQAALQAAEVEHAWAVTAMEVHRDTAFPAEVLWEHDLVVAYFHTSGANNADLLADLVDFANDGGYLVFSTWTPGNGGQEVYQAVGSGFDRTVNQPGILITAGDPDHRP